KLAVKFNRGTFSWCTYTGTSAETILFEKDVWKTTGRALDLYDIYLHFRVASDVESTLKLSVKYDARERIEVVVCEPGGIAAVHMRAGDIIREVNDHAVSSKEMFYYWMLDSVSSNGWVKVTVERAAGGDDAYRDLIEMPPDVMDIAKRQIEAYKQALTKPKPKPVIRGKASGSTRKAVRLHNVPTEYAVQSDYDPTKLKSCKSAK
ncbi:Protein MPZ-5, partial [Aphelenchoides avenae]